MPVHFFMTSEENFAICLRRGLAAVPGGTTGSVRDQLAARLALIRRGDRILFYITGRKEIHGVFRAVEKAFFDDTPVWPPTDKKETYPLRVRFDNSAEVFSRPIPLSDIYDLQDSGKLWSFALQRASGYANAIFSISDVEFEDLRRLFIKLNHLGDEPAQIAEPYRHFAPNLVSRLSLDESGQPQYEATLTALLFDALAAGRHADIFGAYSDYLGYVPTSFQKEIDVVLFHAFPDRPFDVAAYSLLELKRDKFDEDGLGQLLRYEDWFLKKRVAGDSRALRVIAIARTFNPRVREYLAMRERLEGKRVLLLRYDVSESRLRLHREDTHTKGPGA